MATENSVAIVKGCTLFNQATIQASHPGSHTGDGMSLFVTMRSARGKMAPSWIPPSTLDTTMQTAASAKTAACGRRYWRSRR